MWPTLPSRRRLKVGGRHCNRRWKVIWLELVVSQHHLSPLGHMGISMGQRLGGIQAKIAEKGQTGRIAQDGLFLLQTGTVWERTLRGDFKVAIPNKEWYTPPKLGDPPQNAIPRMFRRSILR